MAKSCKAINVIDLIETEFKVVVHAYEPSLGLADDNMVPDVSYELDADVRVEGQCIQRLLLHVVQNPFQIVPLGPQLVEVLVIPRRKGGRGNQTDALRMYYLISVLRAGRPPGVHTLLVSAGSSKICSGRCRRRARSVRGSA